MVQINSFRSAGRIFAAARLDQVARTIYRTRRTRVIIFHGVASSDYSNLEAVIDVLLGTMRPLAPDRFLSHLRNREDPPHPSFIITFDDGLLSSYVAARHILEPRGLRALFFVPTKVVELTTEEEMKRFYVERLSFGRGACQLATKERLGKR